MKGYGEVSTGLITRIYSVESGNSIFFGGWGLEMKDIHGTKLWFDPT